MRVCRFVHAVAALAHHTKSFMPIRIVTQFLFPDTYLGYSAVDAVDIRSGIVYPLTPIF